MAISSANRTGWYIGSKYTSGPKRSRRVARATAVRYTLGDGAEERAIGGERRFLVEHRVDDDVAALQLVAIALGTPHVARHERDLVGTKLLQPRLIG